jgi:trimethylamine--corrinoid protein Co-methyltransferase
MHVLSNIGIIFHDAEALQIFKGNGFKVEGKKVFITEEQVMKALATVPTEFTIQARNPEKSVQLGGDHFALGPCWEPRFSSIPMASGEMPAWTTRTNSANWYKPLPI